MVIMGMIYRNTANSKQHPENCDFNSRKITPSLLLGDIFFLKKVKNYLNKATTFLEYDKLIRVKLLLFFL